MAQKDFDGESSASRHYVDGVFLDDKLRRDNGGYHFGLAAECAVKHLLSKAGVKDDDPKGVLRQHFPDLRPMAIQAAKDRRLQRMVALLRNDNYLQQWSIQVRYRCTGSVSEKQASKWKEDARRTVGLLI